jgi:ABC-type transport system involved in multi-copper enzyme maturation permease subunit
MNLLAVELRRALHRRVVRILILIALVGSVLAGVIAFVDSSGKTLAELHQHESMHPAVLTDWWVASKGDGAVLIAAIFLLMGGLIGGAAVVGAEWRAGTITTVLTWEPRRLRLNLTRTAACGILAFVIAVLVQVLFLASFLPAVVANGSAAGTHAGWWMSLTLVIARTALLTAVAAMFGASLATLGRNTAFAFAVAFAWMAVIENVIRGLRPGWAPYLWTANIGTVVPWKQMEGVEFTRGPLLALGTIVAYTAVMVVAASVAFQRRDIAGAS